MEPPARRSRSHTSHRALLLLVVLSSLAPSWSHAAISIPPNTWVAQAAPAQEIPSGLAGSYEGRGWNHLRYDPAKGQMILFDGYLSPPQYPGGNIYANSIWRYDPVRNQLALEKVSHWTRTGGETVALPENATDPTPYDRHAYGCMVYVGSKDALYLWSGANNSIADNYVGDMWAYSFARRAWRQIPGNHPFTVFEQSMVYDPTLDKIILFGGSDRSYRDGTQTFVFDVKSEIWTDASPVTVPAARTGQSLAFDTARRVVWMFGGALNGQPTNELWRYDARANTWTRIDGSGNGPGARRFANLAYDSRHDLLLLWGGVDGSNGGLTDTWVLHPSSGSWEHLAPATSPGPLVNYAEDLEYDAANDVFVLNQDGKFWLYRVGGPGTSSSTQAGGVQLRLISRNPGRTGMRLSFTLARAGAVRIDLVDSLGRRLSTLARGRYGAGDHEVDWAAASSRRAASGVYYVKLTAEGHTLTRRVVLVR